MLHALASLAPSREDLIDAVQAVPLGQLDQGFDPGACPLAGQGTQRGERELRFGQRKSALDREPTGPLRGCARVGLRLAIEQRQAYRDRILETGGRSSRGSGPLWRARMRASGV
jgi:hypothetical protein